MAKHVLVITGSPRVGGNSDLLAQAVIEGAQAAGCSVERFDAGRANVTGCRDCRACFKDGKACSFSDDDFNTVAPMMQRADTMVLVTPVYCYSWPSNIKSVLDKMISFAYGKQKTGITTTALVAVGEDKDPSMFRAFIGSYETLAKYCHWTDAGHVMVDSCWEAGAVNNQPEQLEAARALGASLGE